MKQIQMRRSWNTRPTTWPVRRTHPSRGDLSQSPLPPLDMKRPPHERSCSKNALFSKGQIRFSFHSLSQLPLHWTMSVKPFSVRPRNVVVASWTVATENHQYGMSHLMG